MGKLKVMTKDTVLKRRRSDLQCGELFKVAKYGSQIIFMAIPECYLRNTTGEDVIANAIRMDTGGLWEISDDLDVIPVNCALVEDYDGNNEELLS